MHEPSVRRRLPRHRPARGSASRDGASVQQLVARTADGSFAVPDGQWHAAARHSVRDERGPRHVDDASRRNAGPAGVGVPELQPELRAGRPIAQRRPKNWIGEATSAHLTGACGGPLELPRRVGDDAVCGVAVLRHQSTLRRHGRALALRRPTRGGRFRCFALRRVTTPGHSAVVTDDVLRSDA